MPLQTNLMFESKAGKQSNVSWDEWSSLSDQIISNKEKIVSQIGELHSMLQKSLIAR
jgi:hypothetical protein